MLTTVFEDLILDDAPMERFSFDGGTKRLKLAIDDDTGKTHHFCFEGVTGFRYHPTVCFDRRRIFVDGVYRKTILKEEDSEWIKELNHAEKEQLEPVSCSLGHYIFPSDEGVYELLARSVNRIIQNK